MPASVAVIERMIWRPDPRRLGDGLTDNILPKVLPPQLGIFLIANGRPIETDAECTVPLHMTFRTARRKGSARDGFGNDRHRRALDAKLNSVALPC